MELGIGRGAVGLLLAEGKVRPFSGAIATLGRQTVLLSGKEVRGQFDRYRTAPALPIPDDADDVALFKAMGFARVESFDHSDFEGATHIVDLNKRLPDQFSARYDVVFDSGTIEHVFHIPNALENAVSLAKVGGRVMFLSPSANHVDHGFYMFSPTLFLDYLLANGFRVETSYLVRYSVNAHAPWQAYAYERDSFRKFSTGAMDSRPYLIFVVATKLPGATADKIPQQTFYTAQWEAGAALSKQGRYAKLQRILQRIPGAMTLALFFWPMIAKRGRWGLKHVADF